MNPGNLLPYVYVTGMPPQLPVQVFYVISQPLALTGSNDRKRDSDMPNLVPWWEEDPDEPPQKPVKVEEPDENPVAAPEKQDVAVRYIKEEVESDDEDRLVIVTDEDSEEAKKVIPGR